jgi:hypothetical protein
MDSKKKEKEKKKHLVSVGDLGGACGRKEERK